MSDYLKNTIRTIPHWPKEGVMFRDITTLIKDDKAFGQVIQKLEERYAGARIDKIAGIESRGFIFGAALAFALKIGFIPIRKKGKLPAETLTEEYALEYGTDQIEIHKDALTPNQRVVLVDDLIATGGTALASCRLIERLGGQIAECAFVIDLPDLGGSLKLIDAGYQVHYFIQFEGD